MRALRIHEAASDEAAEAAAWYEKERPGLGTEFERAVDEPQTPTAREKAQSSPPSRCQAMRARTMVIALIEDPQDMRS